MTDPHGRTIDYLRISVTDRCNFRCTYCMPQDGVPPKPHDEILRFEEIADVVRAAVRLGISRFRLTGGEPLVRAGIVDLVSMIASLPGVTDLAMSTNASLLEESARPLRDAGLRRVNISLDTLDEMKFRAITRCGELASVLRGVDAALDAGLEPVKINVVTMRGVNEDELERFARLTLDRPLHVRFIEHMRSNAPENVVQPEYVPGEEIKTRLTAAFGKLEPTDRPESSGPATAYRLRDAAGTVGFISAITAPFCASCNRLRLSSDGRLVACLFEGGEVDLRTLLRSNAGDDAIENAFTKAAALKPLRHSRSRAIPMSTLGG